MYSIGEDAWMYSISAEHVLSGGGWTGAEHPHCPRALIVSRRRSNPQLGIIKNEESPQGSIPFQETIVYSSSFIYCRIPAEFCRFTSSVLRCIRRISGLPIAAEKRPLEVVNLLLSTVDECIPLSGEAPTNQLLDALLLSSRVYNPLLQQNPLLVLTKLSPSLTTPPIAIVAWETSTPVSTILTPTSRRDANASPGFSGE